MQKLTRDQKDTLSSFAKTCSILAKKISLGTTTLTPANYYEEKERFFASKDYNPQFTYTNTHISQEEQVNHLMTQLERLELPLDIYHYLQTYLASLLLVEACIRTRGSSTFATTAQALFPWDKQDIDTALATPLTLEFPLEENRRLYTAKEIAEKMQSIIEKELGISHFQVILDHYNDHTIRVGENKLIIGKNVKRNIYNLQRLIVHEIESHVLLRHNVHKANNPLLLLVHYGEWLLYSEGLAVFNEIETKTITTRTYTTYLARLKAVSMIDKSFREIYNELSEMLPAQQAYQTTARVKRGLTDTREPGGFPKDAAYILGYYAVEKHFKQEESLNLLYRYRLPQLGKLMEMYDLGETHEISLPRYIQPYPSPNPSLSF